MTLEEFLRYAASDCVNANHEPPKLACPHCDGTGEILLHDLCESEEHCEQINQIAARIYRDGGPACPRKWTCVACMGTGEKRDD